MKRIALLALLGLALAAPAGAFRRPAPAPRPVPKPSQTRDITVAANIKSKTYHYQGCPQYTGKNVTEMKESAAKKAGSRVCKVCAKPK